MKNYQSNLANNKYLAHSRLQEALHVCEIHLDDLEEWLAVFSIKLLNMRQDIHAIEVQCVLHC